MSNLKKILVIFFVSLLGILIQGTILRAFFPSAYLPNLLIAVLVFVSLTEITGLGAFLAFLIGLTLDLFAGTLIGPWAGSYVVVFLIFSLFAQRLYVGSGLLVALATGVASMATSLVYIFMILPYSEMVGKGVQLVLWEGLLSALMAPLVLVFMRRVYPANTERGGRWGDSY